MRASEEGMDRRGVDRQFGRNEPERSAGSATLPAANRASEMPWSARLPHAAGISAQTALKMRGRAASFLRAY